MPTYSDYALGYDVKELPPSAPAPDFGPSQVTDRLPPVAKPDDEMDWTFGMAMVVLPYAALALFLPALLPRYVAVAPDWATFAAGVTVSNTIQNLAYGDVPDKAVDPVEDFYGWRYLR